MATKYVKNAVGRMIPETINGKPVIPFKGVHKYKTKGRRYAPPLPSCADYPEDGNKLVEDLKTALKNAGIKDGMTISTHHHFRNGDLVANHLFKVISEMGIKDLVWFPSASFPCHEPIIEYLEDETIHHIEGSMNGPLGRFASQGKMRGAGVKKLFLLSASPPRTRCEYMPPPKRKLIAEKQQIYSYKKIAEEMGYDGFFSLGVDDILSCLDDATQYCTKCFSSPKI